MEWEEGLASSGAEQAKNKWSIYLAPLKLDTPRASGNPALRASLTPMNQPEDQRPPVHPTAGRFDRLLVMQLPVAPESESLDTGHKEVQAVLTQFDIPSEIWQECMDVSAQGVLRTHTDTH